MESMMERGLSLDPHVFRTLCARACAMVQDHLAHLGARPVFQPLPEAIFRDILSQKLPSQGLDPETILDLCERWVLPYPKGNGHPRYAAWINEAPAPLGVLAHLLMAALNIFASGGNHTATVVEHRTIRWLMELVGFPSVGSMGLLTSGGSVSTLVALNAARYWAAQQHGWNVREEGLQGEHPLMTLYASQEVHSCVQKVVELLGLGRSALRLIPTNDGRMDLDAFRQAVEEDLAQGFCPFCVIANAGTVNTGAVDPLEGLADLARSYTLWLHVDGAYGGFFATAPSLHDHFRGMERADSLVIDPHKCLSVPVGCGAVLVRDATLLFDASSLIAPYLAMGRGTSLYGGTLPWFSDYGLELSRPFTALGVWMVLLQLGREGVAAQVLRYHTLARLLASLVEEDVDFELLSPVTLSTVCFRFAPASLQGDEQALAQVNRNLVEAVQVGGEAFLAGTTVQDRYVLRCCLMHHRATERDIAAIFSTVRRVAHRLAPRGATA